MLLAKAQALVTLTKQEGAEVELEFTDEVMPEFEAAENPQYFQLWLSGDEILGRSKSLHGGDLPRFEDRAEKPRFEDLILANGRTGRRVQIDFVPKLDVGDDEEDDEDDDSAVSNPPPIPVSLVLARSRDKLDQLLGTIHLTLLTTGLIVMTLIVLLVRHAVKLSLRPLDEIRKQLIRLDVASLSARLKLPHRTEELEQLVNQFNDLLTRLQSAFDHERQFSADVAHELRTPLAEISSLAEVGGEWPHDAELAQDFFAEVLAAARQMERMVANLLALARCEKGMEVVDPTQQDLITLIDAAWGRVASDANAKRLNFRRKGPSSLSVNTGRDQFELILNNLFSNAIAYSPAGSDVTCLVDSSGHSFELSVVNRAEHLDEHDLPRLFDRLWRKDPARTGDHHAGLGLTLVKAYAEQLQLSVATRLNGRQTFCLSLAGSLNMGACVLASA